VVDPWREGEMCCELRTQFWFGSSDCRVVFRYDGGEGILVFFFISQLCEYIFD
jgi:hypothetical protein